MLKKQVSGNSGTCFFDSMCAGNAPVSDLAVTSEGLMDAWQHTTRQLRRSRQGTGTPSPSQLLLEEDTWKSPGKRVPRHGADPTRLELRSPAPVGVTAPILRGPRDFSLIPATLRADVFPYSPPANTFAWRMGSAALLIACAPRLPAAPDSSISNSL